MLCSSKSYALFGENECFEKLLMSVWISMTFVEI